MDGALGIGQPFNLPLICQWLLVHDVRMLFLVLKMLWWRMCSLFCRHCDR